MSELPEGWVETQISSVTTDVEQRVPVGLDVFNYIDIGSIDRIEKRITLAQQLTAKDAPSRARKCVKAGDTLVSMTRPNLNSVALVPNKLDGQIASTGFDVLRPVGVDARWIFYLVRSANFVESMSALVQGALYPAIRSKDIRAFQIPLPPLPEQTRIANKLDTLLARVDSARDRLDRVPGMLKRFRQAVLTAATSGVLTEAWRELNLNSIENCSLSSICIKITDGEHISPPITEIGVPLVSAKDVREWGVDFSDTKFVPDTFSIISRKRCDPSKGDVLVVSRGATIGRTCLISTDQVFCLMGSVLLFRPNKDFVTPEFFALLLKSPSGLSQLTAASGASAQSAIYIRDVKQLNVLVPTLPEQTEIVRQVEILFAYADRLEARLKAARKLSESLSPAILAKAFRGELVAQDPNDEPAVELLRRIRAGRK